MNGQFHSGIAHFHHAQGAGTDSDPQLAPLFLSAKEKVIQQYHPQIHEVA